MTRFALIPGEAQVVDAGFTVFWLHEGVVYAHAQPGAPTRELPYVEKVFELLEPLIAGEPKPFFFDAREIAWLDPKARNFLHASLGAIATRVAFIVDPAMKRAMTHAWVGFEEPSVPVAFFDDEEEAWEWVTAECTDVP